MQLRKNQIVTPFKIESYFLIYFEKNAFKNPESVLINYLINASIFSEVYL